MDRLYEIAEVREALRVACEEAGGQKAWAEANNLSRVYVNNVLKGRKPISRKIAYPLGYRKHVLFEKVGQ